MSPRGCSGSGAVVKPHSQDPQDKPTLRRSLPPLYIDRFTIQIVFYPCLGF